MSQECFGLPFDDTQLPFTEDERLKQEEDAREDAGLDEDDEEYRWLEGYRELWSEM